MTIRVAAIVVLCALTGCVPAGNPLSELAAPQGPASAYRVRAGDTLSVDVWGEPRLSGERFVRDDGRLTMALINDVPAEGKSLEELAKDIERRLAKYVPAASVAVSVSRSAPIRYYLSGAFQRPGEYRSDSRITLLQAIATGGDFQPFANRGAIVLLRKVGDSERRYVLDYSKVIAGKQPNPQIQEGDLISVE
jgi:polysaccharide biosynthesis/export protein